MKTAKIILLSFLPAVIQPQAAGVRRSETIERTFRFGAAAATRTLIVDNVSGSIDVRGTDGETVRLKAVRTLEARSGERALAAGAVRLEITETDTLVELYVDGPFREKDRRSRRWKGEEREGYRVVYDFELEVPRNVRIELSTVNDGDIHVEGTAGYFDVHNINGSVSMRKIRGHGHAYALNGDLEFDFDRNPEEDCRFGSLNGKVKVRFNSPLHADFRVKTFNGEVYTDYDFIPLPPEKMKVVRKGGKTLYKADKGSRIRTGRGGPEIEFDGFNGDMFILKK